MQTYEDKQVGALMQVSTEMVADAAFPVEEYVKGRLTRQLEEFCGTEMFLVPSSLKIEKMDGGHWYEQPRTLWQRLLRRPAEQKWVPMVGFRATAIARRRTDGEVHLAGLD